ncbi:MAG: hypothetical protein F4Y80_01195 [Caldilineaceae bacterium SB0665_bin_21]|nr:hypothetical protein [Caldilineaceae bacterium SB0665_bin_21]
MCIISDENCQKLLSQLADGTQDVDHKLLLPPKCRANPGIGLIASYEWKLQGIATGFSWGLHIGRTLAGLGAVLVIVLNWFAGWNLPMMFELLAKVFGAAAERPLVSALVIVVPTIILIVLTAFLSGKVSFHLRSLDLDPNGIFHLSPKGGRCYTPWSKITSIRTGPRWAISLIQANGDILTFWVSRADHKKLSKLIPGLIKRHQPSNLQGRWPDSDL